MKNWYFFNKRPRTNQFGQGLIEYGLIIMLVGIAVIVAVNLFEDALRDSFNSFIGRGEFAPPALGPIGGNFTPRPATPTPVPVPPEISAFAVNGANPFRINDPTAQNTFSFTISAADSDGIITQYRFDIDLNNDGVYEDSIVWNPGEQVPTYILGRGTHIIKLTVSDSTSLTTSRQLPVQVYYNPNELQDFPPVVDITVSPTSGIAPLTVNLSGTATPDHDSTIVRYTWVLGNEATRSGESVTYTYETGGTYELYLQVEDNEGLITDSQRITISIIVPTLTPSLTPSHTATPELKQYRYVMFQSLSEVSGGNTAAVAEFNAVDGLGATINRSGWSKRFANSEASGSPGQNMWDGNNSTIWLTQNVPHPHQVEIDMGANYSLSGFRYVPRQDSSSGRVAGYRFCASTNGVNWELLDAGVLTNAASEQTKTFTPPGPTTAVNTCTVATPSPTRTPSQTPTPSRTPTRTPTPTNTPVAVHVGDLDRLSQPGSGNRWDAHVTIAVHNAGHGLMQGVTVKGSWSNGASGSGECTTNSFGLCTISISDIHQNTNSVTFTITSLVRSGYSYSPSSNHDPDNNDQSDGTTIIVNTP